MIGLTDRQCAVLCYLADFIEVRPHPPTIREIQAYFGFRSPNSVAAHLGALERKGWIRRVKGKSRNIEVLNRCTNRTQPEKPIE
jgi:repressor LexA